MTIQPKIKQMIQLFSVNCADGLETSRCFVQKVFSVKAGMKIVGIGIALNSPMGYTPSVGRRHT